MISEEGPSFFSEFIGGILLLGFRFFNSSVEKEPILSILYNIKHTHIHRIQCYFWCYIMRYLSDQTRLIFLKTSRIAILTFVWNGSMNNKLRQKIKIKKGISVFLWFVLFFIVIVFSITKKDFSFRNPKIWRITCFFIRTSNFHLRLGLFLFFYKYTLPRCFSEILPVSIHQVEKYYDWNKK